MGGRRHSLSETEDDVGETFRDVLVLVHDVKGHVPDVEARAPSVFPLSRVKLAKEKKLQAYVRKGW